jgi:hypothetical protein
MLFYHVLINLFFNIIFLFGGVGKGWLNYFSGFRMVRLFVFYLFVFFGMVGIWDSDLMELKGTCDWVPFGFFVGYF